MGTVAARLLLIIAAILGLVILAYGGWLDFAVWDTERAKPNPYLLGPPKIERTLSPAEP